MPLPEPKPNESESAFLSRCITDATMEDEWPDEDQRAAICEDIWAGDGPDAKLIAQHLEYCIEKLHTDYTDSD